MTSVFSIQRVEVAAWISLPPGPLPIAPSFHIGRRSTVARAALATLSSEAM